MFKQVVHMMILCIALQRKKDLVSLVLTLAMENADGALVYTGFKPAMVIYKRSDGTEGWLIQDNRRPGYNPMGGNLFPNVNNAESTDARFDFLSNGFKARSGNQNTSGSIAYLHGVCISTISRQQQRTMYSKVIKL